VCVDNYTETFAIKAGAGDFTVKKKKNTRRCVTQKLEKRERKKNTNESQDKVTATGIHTILP
jgi:hypothetical protein